MSYRKRVSLIDGDSRRRAAICHLLATAGYQIEPFDGLDELSACDREAIPMLVWDDDNAIPRVLDHMARTGAWMPIIALGGFFEPYRVLEAGRLGAADYLIWPFTLEQVSLSLKRAEEHVPTLIDNKYREVAAQERLGRLSTREREVLSWVARGLRNREIGRRLSISERTVERHRANLIDKLGVKGSTDAIRLATEALMVKEIA